MGQGKYPFIWLAALFVGASYMVPVLAEWSGPAIIAWKGAGVGLLALWALLAAPSRDGKIIAAVLVLGALGDVLLDAVALETGALAFAAGHVIAIAFYLRNRRTQLAASQRALGIILIPASIIIALAALGPLGQVLERLGSEQGADIQGLLVYTALVSAMAASAWSSRFPRYRVGIGAMMFLISDLVIFTEQGRFAGELWPSLLIWPLYFAGQALIARGVVMTLRREVST